MKILNCGITGGQRDIMLKFLTRMVQVLQDPALAIRQKNEDINLSLNRPEIIDSLIHSKSIMGSWGDHGVMG